MNGRSIKRKNLPKGGDDNDKRIVSELEDYRKAREFVGLVD